MIRDVRHNTIMKYVLLLLIASVQFTQTTWGAETIRQQDATFPGGSAQFFLRGTNLIYERVLYTVPQPADATQTNWVERFYYRGQLVFQRCSAIQQITATTMAASGVSVFQGEARFADGTTSRRLKVGELDKTVSFEAGEWVRPFELFTMAADGFYYPKDPAAHAEMFSSFIWLTDDPGSPFSRDEIQRLRSRVLKATIGEPDGAANRSQPIRAETNRTSSAAGSDR